MFKLYEGAGWGGPECLNCMKALDGGDPECLNCMKALDGGS